MKTNLLLSKGRAMHAIASSLRGFRSSSLRVVVERIDGNYAWVRTADLVDSGTPLVINPSQLTAESTETVPHHKDGLVLFG